MCEKSLFALLLSAALLPLTANAQGPPGIVWMAGGHAFRVWSVAYSPDGQMLASGSRDNTIKLWNVSDGELIRTLTGHTGWVNSVAFSPDGQTLACMGRGRVSFRSYRRLWRETVSEALRRFLRRIRRSTDLNRLKSYAPHAADDKTVSNIRFSAFCAFGSVTAPVHYYRQLSRPTNHRPTAATQCTSATRRLTN